MRRLTVLVWLISISTVGACVSLDKPQNVVECEGKGNCQNATGGAGGGDTGPATDSSTAGWDVPAPDFDAMPDVPEQTGLGDSGTGQESGDAAGDSMSDDGAVDAPGDAPDETRGDAFNDAPGDTAPPRDGNDAKSDRAGDLPRDATSLGTCSSGGTIFAAGVVCREAADLCDKPEVCDGIHSTCPPDVFATVGTPCRAAAGDCDIAETCSGTSMECPSDTLKSKGALCRKAAGPCDLAESCSGDSPLCPEDLFAPASTVCHASDDDNRCDPAEVCSGSGAACPTDVSYTVPATPVGVTATAGELQVSLTWTPVPGATGYNVSRSLDSVIGYTTLGGSPTTTTASYVDTQLVGGATYYYRVAAVKAIPSCRSDLSAAVPGTPGGTCAPPPVPAAVTATPANGQVTLSWTASTGATAYTIARSTSSGTGYVSIGAVTGETTYLDTAVVNGVRYYYVVSASNGRCGSASSVEVATSPSCTPPAAPTDLAATANNGSVALTWTAPPGAVSYRVLRRTGSEPSLTLLGTSPTPSFTDSTVINNVTYYYTVSASNGFCNSVEADEVAATPVCLPPSVPTGLVATPGNGQVLLTWDPSDGGAASYTVSRSSSSTGTFAALDTTTGASYTDATVSNGVTYYYVVSASNGSCSSANSPAVPATPLCSPPSVPTDLTATPGDHQVALSWTASTGGATSYSVQRSEVHSGPYSAIAAATTTSYTDTTALNGTKYYYVVQSTNGSCPSANSAEVSATPAPACGLAAPTGLTATAGNKQVTLTWTGSTGATSYSIGRSTTAGAGYASVGTATTTSYVDNDTALVNGRTYYYVVAAVGTCTSASSSEASATPACTPPAAPSNVKATANNSNGAITITWDVVTNATGYTVSRSTSATGTFTAVSTNQTAATYTDSTGLTGGNTYYYRVVASNGGGTCSSTPSTASSAMSCANPAAPTGLAATVGATSGQVALTWTGSTGATSYEVLYSTTNGGPYTTSGGTSTTASANVSSLTNDTTYYFVVVAHNGTNGNCKSDASAQLSSTPRQCQVFSASKTATGNFLTTGPYCFVTCWDIAGYQCSNVSGRSLTVNGSNAPCNGNNLGNVLPPKRNGAYTFSFSSGTYNYSSMSYWGTGHDCAP